MRTILTADYGAGPDRSPEENTRALQAAMREAWRTGGCTVVLSAGEYLPPPIDDGATDNTRRIPLWGLPPYNPKIYLPFNSEEADGHE